jgi:hypothetical protein
MHRTYEKYNILVVQFEEERALERPGRRVDDDARIVGHLR